jgi:hypothetical protein
MQLIDYARLNVAFVGDITTIFMSSRQRLESMRALGVQVAALDVNPLKSKGLWGNKVLPRLLNLPAGPRDIARYNSAVSSLQNQRAPHIAWFEWPRLLRRETLLALRRAWPNTLFVCYQDDNPFGLRKEARMWKLFIQSIPDFDVHLVKRPSDVEMFGRHGAPCTFVYTTGYFEPLFEASDDPQPDKNVLFVGTALDHRVPFLESLVLEYGIDVEIHGGKWNRARRLSRLRPDLLHGHIDDRDYVRAIREHRITLGFVSSSNHDEYTGRSFEIPAAGGFLLAERTETHCRLFQEGLEAEFFSSVEECADKIRHYLSSESDRQTIARRGRLLCQEAGYGLRHRLDATLKKLLPMLKKPLADS